MGKTNNISWRTVYKGWMKPPAVKQHNLTGIYLPTFCFLSGFEIKFGCSCINITANIPFAERASCRS